jgi:hypothetical protein
MFAASNFSVSQLCIVLVIGLLLFAQRLPKVRHRQDVRVWHTSQRREEPTRPQTEKAVPVWLVLALSWLWREFYFWTISDWECE